MTHLTERAKIEGIDLSEIIVDKQPEINNKTSEVIRQPIKHQTTRDQE